MGKQPLDPDDFPVPNEREKLVTNYGKPITNASSESVAEDVADRLNTMRLARKRTVGRCKGSSNEKEPLFGIDRRANRAGRPHAYLQGPGARERPHNEKRLLENSI